MGNEFKQWRTQNGISRNKATQLMNVSLSCVESWEQGRRNMNGAALRLFQVFRANPSIIASFVSE